MRERVAKNGRLTVSLPVHVVEKLEMIGKMLEQENGVEYSYAQIVSHIAHAYMKEGQPDA